MDMKNPSDQRIKEILDTKKRIAVVGLSDNPDRTSYMVTQAMQDAGYKIVPINPNVEHVLGEKSYRSISDLDVEVDMVNIFRRSEFLPELAKETVEAGIPIFWTQLGVVDEGAYDYLQEHNVETVMDRCIKVEHAKFK
ncbi:CoA-binding protein [Alkalihalobacillus sp. LMS6]|uniref:CoA-binding protein n=2 Tax=Bacillales TaxID=1385 RepID=UPI0020D0A5E1|nr:CoA-binding protein [Alkalihalobacillus sp. LMS6]UTR08300.1 CoA-binding protein [Alkalihalobacillus sp. LMS6]